MIRRCLCLLMVLLASIALASSTEYGQPVQGRVVAAEQAGRDWKLKVELTESPGRVPNHDRKTYKKGSVVETSVKKAERSFKKGDPVKVRWMSYSGMGPNGPVVGLSWELAP